MRLLGGVLDVCVDEERVRLTVDVFYGNLKAVETLSFRQRDFRCKIAAEILIDNAIRCCEKARMWEMKCCSVGESLFQSAALAERLISSAVQKDASAFLYIRQILLCWMGKRTKR